MRTLHRKRIVLLSVVVLLLITASLAAASYSFASQDLPSQVHFESSLVGSTPGAFIGGIGSAGAPWVVTAGETGISPNGMLHLTVVGLVLSLPGSPLDGTTGPVREVIASLVCQNSAPLIINTTSVPLSSNGNAHINQEISLPSTCFAPVILVRISVLSTSSGTTNLGTSGPWIASTGFTSE